MSLSTPEHIRDAFTDLAAAAVANRTKGTIDAFWDAIYALDTWHFFPDLDPGERLEDRRAAQRPIEALVATVKGKRYIPVFTSERRALAAAAQNGLAQVEDGYGILSLDRDVAAAYLSGVPNDRADGVVFNHNRGQPGMIAPLAEIPLQYGRFRDRTSPLMFDILVRTAVRANSDELWGKLNSWLAAMERLYFVGSRARHSSPSIAFVEGKAVAVLFTTREHAMQGAAISGEWSDGEQTPLISMTTPDAAAYLEDLARASAAIGHAITSVAVNRGGAAYLTEINDLCERIRRRNGFPR